MDLPGDFVGKVRQPAITFKFWVRRVAAKNDFLNSKAVAGAEEGADVMGASDVVGDQGDVHETMMQQSGRKS